MKCRFPVLLTVTLMMSLLTGCGKRSSNDVSNAGPTDEPGVLPACDAATEAEAAAQRLAKMEKARPGDVKTVEAIRSRLKLPAFQATNPRPLSISLRGDPDYVQGVLLSPDGTRIVTAEHSSAKKTNLLRVMDLATGRELCRFTTLLGVPYIWSFSPDGMRIATAGQDKHLRIWDATSGQQVQDIPFDEMIWSLAYTPDGSGVAASIAGRLVLIDSQSGQTRRTYAEKSVHTANPAYSPSGALLASTAGGSLDRIALWEAATGRKIFEKMMPSSQGVVFSPDGWSMLVNGIGGLNLLDLTTRQEQLISKGSDGPSSPIFSPDGHLLAYKIYKGLVIRDCKTNAERLTPDVVGKVVGFFPGGSIVATFDNGTLHLWNVESIRSPHAE